MEGKIEKEVIFENLDEFLSNENFLQKKKSFDKIGGIPLSLFAKNYLLIYSRMDSGYFRHFNNHEPCIQNIVKMAADEYLATYRNFTKDDGFAFEISNYIDYFVKQCKMDSNCPLVHLFELQMKTVEGLWSQMQPDLKYKQLRNVLVEFRQTHPNFYLFGAKNTEKERYLFSRIVLDHFGLNYGFSLEGFNKTFKTDSYTIDGLGFFFCLSEKLLTAVLSYCPSEDIVNFLKLSKQYCNIDTEDFWRNILELRFNVQNKPPNLTWKMTFFYTEKVKRMRRRIRELSN